MEIPSKYKGLFFNILFIAYVLFLQDRLAMRMDTVMAEKTPWITMGFILFVLSILEGLYLPVKIRHVFHTTGRELSPNAFTIWFMPATIFRMLLGLVVAATVFGLLTPDIMEKTVLTTVGTVMAIVLLIKELVILFVVLAVLLKNSARACSSRVEWAGDTLLLAYGCIVYTIISRPGMFFPQSVSHSYEMLPLTILCFLMFILALRLGFCVEEFLTRYTLRGKLAIWGSLFIAALSASLGMIR